MDDKKNKSLAGQYTSSEGVINHLLSQIADVSYKLAIVSAELVRSNEKIEELLKKEKELQKLKSGGKSDNK